MTGSPYRDNKEELVLVHIRSAEQPREWREERFCSKGRRRPLSPDRGLSVIWRAQSS